MGTQYQMTWTFGGRMTPTVRKLIYINSILFIIQLFSEKMIGIDLSLWLGFIPQVFLNHYYVWQPFTYLFLHGGLMHILFNMLILWMLGGEIEEKVFWSKGFLKFYLICGIGAALFYLIFFNKSQVPIIGASGAIYGILVAYAVFFGNRQLILFPLPVFIRAKYFVLMILLIELVSSVFYSEDGIAHTAHLGGAVIGYIYIRTKIQGPKNMIRGLFKNPFTKKPKFRVIEGGYKDFQ